MSLADEFATDAVDLIDGFGEAVELRRYGSGEVVVRTAFVRRRTLEAAPVGAGRPLPVIDVMFSTDPVTGVDPDSIDFARDSVAVALYFGGPLTAFQIGSHHALVARSPGRFTLRVR